MREFTITITDEEWGRMEDRYQPVNANVKVAECDMVESVIPFNCRVRHNTNTDGKRVENVRRLAETITNNSLFADRDTIGEALNYLYELANSERGTGANVKILTGAYVLMNTIANELRRMTE